MGILSWVTGKRKNQEAITHFPSDHVLAGKIAGLIAFYLFGQEAKDAVSLSSSSRCVWRSSEKMGASASAGLLLLTSYMTL